MTTKAFDKIMAGLNDALDIVEDRADPSTYRVHIPAEIDTRAIRAKMQLSQAQFAQRFGFSAASVRDWEQGRRVPDAGTRAFLTVTSKETEAVERALGWVVVAVVAPCPLCDMSRESAAIQLVVTLNWIGSA